MSRLLLLIVFGAGVANAASAQTHTCSGAARGLGGSAAVSLRIEGGSVVRGDATWSPRADSSNPPASRVLLQRAYIDPENGELGPYAALVTFNQAPLTPDAPPELLVAASTNLSPPVGRTWGQYAAAFRSAPSPQGEPIGFVGTVIFNRAMPEAAPLLDSLETADTLITSVSDVAGTKLVSRALFWLTDRAAATKLLQSAHAEAKAAAREPATRCKPATP